MPRIFHIRIDLPAACSQSQHVSCEVQSPLHCFQSALTHKCRNIRLQDKRRELTLGASRSDRNISCVLHFNNPTLTKFEAGLRRVRGDLRKSHSSKDRIATPKPTEANQIGSGARAQNDHTIIFGASKLASCPQGGRECLLRVNLIRFSLRPTQIRRL